MWCREKRRVGKQSLLPQKASLWHEGHFRLIVFKKQKTASLPLQPASASPRNCLEECGQRPWSTTSTVARPSRVRAACGPRNLAGPGDQSLFWVPTVHQTAASPSPGELPLFPAKSQALPSSSLRCNISLSYPTCPGVSLFLQRSLIHIIEQFSSVNLSHFNLILRLDRRSQKELRKFAPHPQKNEKSGKVLKSFLRGNGKGANFKKVNKMSKRKGYFKYPKVNKGTQKKKGLYEYLVETTFHMENIYKQTNFWNLIKSLIFLKEKKLISPFVKRCTSDSLQQLNILIQVHTMSNSSEA